MITDMTSGHPARILWKFSLPLLFSVVFQQLYNIVDSIVAGRFIGEDALAAVGASYPITMIFMAVATGANIGCSVIISQLFGARDYKNMKTAVSTSLISILSLGAVLTALGLAVSSPLMRLLNTPENIFSDAGVYLGIYIGGLLFLFLYNICTGIFTALGDSKTPLYFLIFSSLLNIVLDLVFVIVFKMGVAGVAWATFIAQGFSSLLASVNLAGKLKGVTAEGSYPKFSGRMLVKICTVAIPSILQQSFISVGNLLIQSLVNGYGSAVIAGYSAAVKLNTFSITSFTTLANGLSSFTAQNIGAAKPERVKKGFKAGVVMAIAVVLPFFLAYFGFSKGMLGIFLKSTSADAISAGVSFLKIVSPFYFVISLKLMADGVLRGAGAMVPFMIATFVDLILRVILSYVLAGPAGFGSDGIWMSWPIGWTIAAVISLIFYFTGTWKRHDT